MSEPKVCRSCGNPKPLDAFSKAPARFGGDGRRKDCKECHALKRATQAGEEVSSAPESPAEAPEFPSVQVANSLGFDAQYDGTDFIVSQKNGEDEHTVILAPHELKRLWEFAEGLAKAAEAGSAP